jgi:rare lipoprotein A
MPRAAANPRVETASVTTYDQGRMSLTAAPPRPTFQPFAPQRAYVQVGLFRDRSNAERLRRELGTLGPVEVAPVQVEDGAQVYRVRIGPFSPETANRTQNQVAAYGVPNTAVVTD